MSRLLKRLSALEGWGGGDFVPWCCVFAEDDEDEDEDRAVERHIAGGECKPNGGHWVIRFTDSPARSAAA